MKPPVFDYHSPHSLEEACSLLSQFGSDARILAGGQSLIPMMKLRLARPAVLIDINEIAELDFIQPRENHVAIGALRRLFKLESDVLFGAGKMILQALPHIGHVATRHRGTTCGSFAHADPAAELPVIASSLDVEIIATSKRGERRIPADEFFVSFFTTSLADDELIQEVRFPRLPENAGYSFLELSKRHAKFVLAAVMVARGANQRIEQARIAIGAVGERPFRAVYAERALIGEVGTADNFQAAAAASVQGLDPPSDVHGSSVFRKKAAQVLVRRALEEAWISSIVAEG